VDFSFQEHLDVLNACRACPNVFGQPVTGAVPGARVMLVGQAPGPHEVDQRRPFAYTAGRRLFGWFTEHTGISESDFRSCIHICAVIRCFPGKDAKSGGDRVPDAVEIANCGKHLDREIGLLEPELVIAVGTLASAQLIGIAQLKDAVGGMHRAERAGHSFDLVVLPHPSGRSTWLNKPENKAMLERSMWLIREHAGFGSSAASTTTARPEKSSLPKAKSRARRRRS
jgi:uracil-DNA glycosylase